MRLRIQADLLMDVVAMHVNGPFQKILLSMILIASFMVAADFGAARIEMDGPADWVDFYGSIEGRTGVTEGEGLWTFVHLQEGRTMGEMTEMLSILGAQVHTTYSIAPVASVLFPDIQTAERASALDVVERIEPQREPTLLLDVSAAGVKAAASAEYSPETTEDLGLDGSGVTIAVMDTGIDNEHPTFQGAFVAGVDFTLAESSLTPRDGTYDPDDIVGHGTGVASIAVGRGVEGGVRKGIAPGAGLIDLKIVGGRPLGLRPTGGAILDALQWCADNKDTPWGNSSYVGVDVVSISLAIGNENMAVSEAIDNLVSNGTVVVMGAGNSGTSYVEQQETTWPDRAIIVGGTDDKNTIERDDDEAWTTSTYGPRTDDGDAYPFDELKPDVSAPAVDIAYASYSRTSRLQAANGWSSGSGTSFATPHVAGSIALMLQADPEIAPRAALNPPLVLIHQSSESRGVPFNDSVSEKYDIHYGFGILDAYEAAKASGAYTAVNHRPEIRYLRLQPTTVTVGSTARVETLAEDPDEDPLTYRLTIEAGELQGSGPVWTWTAPNSPGTYSFSLDVSDPFGGSDQLTTGIKVLEGPPNRSPLITSIRSTPEQVKVGGTSTLTASAQDPDGDDLTYSYQAVLGTVTGTGTKVTYRAPPQPGTDRVTLTVTDGKGGEDSRYLDIKVVKSTENNPPFIASLDITPDIVNGSTVNMDLVLYAEVSDPDGASDIRFVVADLSTVGGVSGTEMMDDGVYPDEVASDRIYTLMIPDASSFDNGEYQVEVTVIDRSNASASSTIAFKVDLGEPSDISKGKSGLIDALASPVALVLMLCFLALAVGLFVALRIRKVRKGYLQHPEYSRVRFRPTTPQWPAQGAAYAPPLDEMDLEGGT